MVTQNTVKQLQVTCFNVGSQRKPDRNIYVPQFVLANHKVVSRGNNEVALLTPTMDPELSLLMLIWVFLFPSKKIKCGLVFVLKNFFFRKKIQPLFFNFEVGSNINWPPRGYLKKKIFRIFLRVIIVLSFENIHSF